MSREITNSIRIFNEIAGKFQWKLFIIVAEGDKTERNYFQTLEKKYKEDFRKRDLYFKWLDRDDPSYSDPQSVYQTMQDFCEELKSERDIKKYDEFWIVIDTDEHENRKEVIERIVEDCENLQNYYLALSNPCFEVWLICHFVDLDAKLSDYIKGYDDKDKSVQEYIESYGFRGRPKICKQIFAQLHQGKGQLYDILIDRIPQAIPRAKKLGKCSLDPVQYPQNICTNLYQLFENLGYSEVTS